MRPPVRWSFLIPGRYESGVSFHPLEDISTPMISRHISVSAWMSLGTALACDENATNLYTPVNARTPKGATKCYQPFEIGKTRRTCPNVYLDAIIFRVWKVTCHHFDFGSDRCREGIEVTENICNFVISKPLDDIRRKTNLAIPLLSPYLT